jgi:hypothetical protein
VLCWHFYEVGKGRKLRPTFVQVTTTSRDRCNDLKNIFAQKIGEKFGVFETLQTLIVQNFDPNIGF